MITVNYHKTCPNGQDLRLVINEQVVEVNEPADRTALQYLRANGLTGTKEGCASGDCGACTVMVGELKDRKVEFKAVNSCIVPVGQLSGMHVVTVELSLIHI